MRRYGNWAKDYTKITASTVVGMPSFRHFYFLHSVTAEVHGARAVGLRRLKARQSMRLAYSREQSKLPKEDIVAQPA